MRIGTGMMMMCVGMGMRGDTIDGWGLLCDGLWMVGGLFGGW